MQEIKDKAQAMKSVASGNSPYRLNVKSVLKDGEKPTTLKQQIKARKYLIKHNIVKKRENYYRYRTKKDGEDQGQIASLTKFLKGVNKKNKDDAYS